MPAKPKSPPPPPPPNKPSSPFLRRRRLIQPEVELPSMSAAEFARQKTIEDKKKVLEALEQCLGIVTYAAKMAGVDRSTIYKWKQTDAEFAAKLTAIDNVQTDFVEGKLMELIRGHGKPGDPGYIAPNSKAVIFYLATKARPRGYSNRVELTTPPGQPLEHKVTGEVREARAETTDRALIAAMAKARQVNPELFDAPDGGED